MFVFGQGVLQAAGMQCSTGIALKHFILFSYFDLEALELFLLERQSR